MNEVKITIIVPVYNVENYLPQCLDSLINQTLREIEIICINDGSTDNSLNILQQYAKLDKRIKVIDKENEGVSTARNTGLENSNGEYIMFVDGDDYVDNKICEKLYTKMTDINADLVIITMHKAFNTHNSFKIYKSKTPYNSDDTFIFYDYPDILSDSYATVWGKLFKKNSLKFHEELRRAGDAVFFWSYCIKYNPKIAFINEPLYYYLQRPTSIVHCVSNVNDCRIFKSIETFTNDEIFKSAQKNIQIKILDRFAKSILSEIKAFKKMNTKYHLECKKFIKKFYLYDRSLRNQLVYFYELKDYIQNTSQEKFFKMCRNIFAITNTKEHKIIKIFGAKLKLRIYREQNLKEKKYINLYKKNYKNFKQDTYLLLDCTTDPTVENIDAYTLFTYMKNNGYSVYYILLKESDLYKKLESANNLQNIIGIDNSTQTNPGDFLEEIYPTLLKTKAILTAFAPFNKMTETFFRTSDTIKYIFIQHGQIHIPERTLDNNYLYPNRFNYMLTSSEQETNLLTSYGWDEKTLIKAGLPRWDLLTQKPSLEKSILIMFTWRRLSGKNFEKSLYKNCILDFINDEQIFKELSENNIKVYFAMHHALSTLSGLNLNMRNKYIELISTQQISQYVKKCSCLITDFSSICFDFMFQDKPVLFYLIDAGDENLNILERKAIDNFNKIGNIPNVFYNKNDVISKLNYYTLNNFVLETETKQQYDKFFYTKENIRKNLTEKLEKITKEPNK